MGSIAIYAGLLVAVLLGGITTDRGKWKFKSSEDPMDNRGLAVPSLDAENRIEA